ncbi:MAG TPA: hypothetical protein VL359_19675, partial [bacterium]|nr:hypothetical protein [bacterium]
PDLDREGSAQPRGPRPHAAERPQRESGERREGGSSGKAWDYGSQVFPVDPGTNGVRIALKRDGSIELYQERDRSHVVAERLVTSRQFRVRQGKIVQPGEPGW